MARMMPASIYKGCASPGEREIFRRLKDDPRTCDWFVLHSLDIADHRRQISGEADFVVVVPSKGILCLEVKACSSLKRSQDGLWYYGTNPKPDARGPFKQASEAMHSIRKYLAKLRPDLAGIMFWSAVIFPYIPFTITSGEWQQWQVIDRQRFMAQPLSKSIETILDRASAHLRQSHSASWFNPVSNQPSLEQSEEIARTLRPSFEFFESSKSQALRIGEEIKHYTEEQFIALDAMETNPRVAFTGPAGTGKTMMAIEAARRGRAAGRRVLLLCFNRHLGRWIEEQVVNLRPEVIATTLHRYMVSVSGVNPRTSVEDRMFWETTLPCLALEKLIEESVESNIFDELIIDEAQDILRSDYLDFLDASLKGGLSSGQWRLFGDFEKQAIYGAANLSLEESLSTRVSNVPLYSLRVNCRNPPRIAETARLLGGLEPNYRKVLRPDNGVEPRIRYYRDAGVQQELLVETLESLSKAGFSNEDVVVLSTRSDAASIAAQVRTHPWKGKLRPFGVPGQGYIRYSSIHAFKGLEAPAVVVTDVDHISDPASMSLFYVAITRAVDRLVLLVHESVREEIIHALT